VLIDANGYCLLADMGLAAHCDVAGDQAEEIAGKSSTWHTAPIGKRENHLLNPKEGSVMRLNRCCVFELSISLSINSFLFACWRLKPHQEILHGNPRVHVSRNDHGQEQARSRGAASVIRRQLRLVGGRYSSVRSPACSQRLMSPRLNSTEPLCMYEMLCGFTPFVAKTIPDIFVRVRSASICLGLFFVMLFSGAQE
jgi:hypothetical protein